ncbi:hypothetical protein DXG01_001400 [Tephrocybe rancida]|nr:hypothetical protein DXG01_001400 [Tephrocybe rancida]
MHTDARCVGAAGGSAVAAWERRRCVRNGMHGGPRVQWIAIMVARKVLAQLLVEVFLVRMKTGFFVIGLGTSLREADAQPPGMVRSISRSGRPGGSVWQGTNLVMDGGAGKADDDL